jgi:hypothetical protein
MISLAPLPTRRPARTLDVEIVVPVFDEQAALERSVRRLHRFLTAEFPFSWRIVIADNASADATPGSPPGWPPRCPASSCSGSSARAAAARCAPPGRRRGSAWSPTWTSTSPPTCADCCRSAPLCRPATASPTRGCGSSAPRSTTCAAWPGWPRRRRSSASSASAS